MVLCGVCYNTSKLKYLDDIGVKDSKQLTPNKRTELATLIKKNCICFKEVHISSEEIDNREVSNISLNQLEVYKIVEIIDTLKPDIIYIDAADVNEERFGQNIGNLLSYKPKEIISKHKADEIYPIVSAASIIAKTSRDTVINSIRTKNINEGHGDIGSGYPSDRKTTEFLRNWIKKYKKVPDFARKSWKTTQRIIDEELNNKKITEFFS